MKVNITWQLRSSEGQGQKKYCPKEQLVPSIYNICHGIQNIWHIIQHLCWMSMQTVPRSSIAIAWWLLAIGQTVPNPKKTVQIVISIFDIRFSPINYSKSRLPKHNTEGYLCELTNTGYTHFSTVQVYNHSTCRPHCASARDRFINNPKCIYWTSEIILGVSIVPYK